MTGVQTCALPISAYGQIAALPRQLAAFFGDFDVLLTPTLSAPPPLLGEMSPDRPADELMARMFGWCGYTPLQNMAGTPAMTLPLAWDEAGLPLGLMFAADRGHEDLLLDRKSTRQNSSHVVNSYAVFCLKKKITNNVFIHRSLTLDPT